MQKNTVNYGKKKLFRKNRKRLAPTCADVCACVCVCVCGCGCAGVCVCGRAGVIVAGRPVILACHSGRFVSFWQDFLSFWQTTDHFGMSLWQGGFIFTVILAVPACFCRGGSNIIS
jgi:hypothetical protein